MTSNEQVPVGSSPQSLTEARSEVTRENIAAAVKELGIQAGDIVLVHSSLKSLGKVIGGPEAVIDAFKSVIGTEGTLVMPTLIQKNFSYAYETWYLGKPSDVGLITEVFRTMPGSYRSDQATHSVAAAGKRARELTEGHTLFGPRYGIHGDYAYAHSSPWQKMYDWGGKVVFIGVTMRKNTFKHFMESIVVEKALDHVLEESERERLRSRIRHYSRRFEAEKEKGIWPFHNGEQLQEALDQAGMLHKTKCGDAVLLAVNIHEVVDKGLQWFEENPEKWYSPDVVQWLNEAKAASQVKHSEGG